MQALELSIPAAGVVTAAQEEGLIVLTAGANVLRLVPPLVIEEAHIQEMEEILDQALRRAAQQ